MARFFFFLCLLPLLFVGCSNKPKMVSVSGKVTLDGKPLPEGEIIFASPGLVPETLPIKDGKYEGKVQVGNKRVEIAAYRDGPRQFMGTQDMGPSRENYIPARYNVNSTLKAEVSDSGPKEFDFAVTSR